MYLGHSAWIAAFAVQPYAAGLHELGAALWEAPTACRTIVCEAGVALRANADAVPGLKGRHLAAHSRHCSDDLMARAVRIGSPSLACCQ